MRRHHFIARYRKKPVMVTMGRDSPLGHFFMFVQWEYGDAPLNSVSEDPVYSTLDEKDESKAFATNFDHIKEKLIAMSIDVPQNMFTQAELDLEQGVGNRDVWYSADGSFTEGVV